MKNCRFSLVQNKLCSLLPAEVLMFSHFVVKTRFVVTDQTLNCHSVVVRSTQVNCCSFRKLQQLLFKHNNVTGLEFMFENSHRK